MGTEVVSCDSYLCTLRLEGPLTMAVPWPWQSKDMGYGAQDAKDQHVSRLPWTSYLQLLCPHLHVSVPAVSTSC